MTTLVVALLFAVGYPTAIVLVAQFRSVVRLRRVRLFLAHQAAMAGIVTGWALLGRPLGVALNAVWFAGGAAWWLWGK